MSWRNRVWAVYLAIAGALMLTYLFFPPLAGNGPLINVLGLSGVVAIVVGIRMHRPRARAAWWLFVVGQFLFWAGDIYTYSYRILFGADVPFPSVGDALYLAVYPALMVGLVLLVKRRNPKRDLMTVPPCSARRDRDAYSRLKLSGLRVRWRVESFRGRTYRIPSAPENWLDNCTKMVARPEPGGTPGVFDGRGAWTTRARDYNPRQEKDRGTGEHRPTGFS